MNLDTLTSDDLFQEISDLAREQGTSSKEDWENLVNEVVESHLSLGELDPDQNLSALKQSLYEFWDEYKREAGPESEDAIDEDPQLPHV